MSKENVKAVVLKSLEGLEPERVVHIPVSSARACGIPVDKAEADYSYKSYRVEDLLALLKDKPGK